MGFGGCGLELTLKSQARFFAPIKSGEFESPHCDANTG